MLAPVCAACAAELERPLSGPVCDACWVAVPRLTMPCCERCGDALVDWRPAHRLCPRCRRRPPLLESALSAGRYDGSLRQIVHAFKYQRRRVLATPLAAMMRAAGADLLNRADGVVPVPLHPWRAFHRGFNQADDLARRLGLPVVRALRRRAGGPPQASLPAAQRHGNVRNAFALRLSQNDLGGRFTNFVKRPPRSFSIRDRSLVLIDDVMTTGATLDACARQLLDAGARSVSGLTIARAVAGPPAPRQPTPHPSDAQHR